MHTTKSLKDKKNHHIVFSYNKKNHIVFFIYTKHKKNSKIGFSMHFDFNNKFVRAMRTRPIFQKFKKNIFVFF
jgi:hypothetical protein